MFLLGGLTSFIHLLKDIRNHDYDRYLCSLFAPYDKQKALGVLLAFNIELSKVRERAADPILGFVRLQWWRDTLTGDLGRASPRHPVARALAELIVHYGLSRATIYEMIDARELEYKEYVFDTQKDMDNYAEATSGNLHRLFLKVLEVSQPEAINAAGKVGKAWALIGLLRSIPFHTERGCLYLPSTYFPGGGDRALDFSQLENEKILPELVERIAEVARGYLVDARMFRHSITKNALPAVLPAILIDVYFKKMKQAEFNPFLMPESMSLPLRQLRLLIASFRNVY